MCRMVCSRSNLVHSINVVSKFMENLGCAHLGTLKWMLRCLNGIILYELVYGQSSPNRETNKGFVDVDCACNADIEKSVDEYVFTIWIYNLLEINLEFIYYQV